VPNWLMRHNARLLGLVAA